MPSRGPDGAAQFGGTLLIVDDEAFLCGVARRVLGAFGFDVLTAGDGEEAVDVFRKEHAAIRLVVLDLELPKLDGLATLREILAVDPAARVLLSSGSDAPGDLEGACGFLRKPYNPAMLVEAVLEGLRAR